jgi:crooked neck
LWTRYELLKRQELKEERVLLLQAWRDAESQISEKGLPDETAMVDSMMPKKVKMRRMAMSEDNVTELGWEEYYDYIFPDDEKKIGKLLLLLLLIYDKLLNISTLLFLCMSR